MKSAIIKTTLWISMGFAVLLLAACGQDGSITGISSGNPTGASSGISSHVAAGKAPRISPHATTGTLQVALTEAVDPSLKEVVISIKGIQVIPKNHKFKRAASLSSITFDPPRVVNLLDLASQEEILGEILVPAGTYRQIRIFLDANSKGEPPANYIRFQDNSIAALTIPGSRTSGLKLFGRFTVTPDKTKMVALDFDLARAIHKTRRHSRRHRWMLNPAGIRLCEVDNVLPQNGAITGFALADYEVVVPDAIVSVFPLGQEQPIATSLVDPEDGSFFASLPAGTYYLEVDAEGYEHATTYPGTFNVIAGEETDAGVINLTRVAPPDGVVTGFALEGYEVVVPDAIVSAVPVGQEQPTATSPVNPEDGSFNLSLPPGTYFLEVDAEGYEHATSYPGTFNVIAGEETDAGIINLTRAITQDGAITGFALAGYEVVVPDAIVSAFALGQEQPTATSPVNPEDGSFRIILPPGTYYLETDADGYHSSTYPFPGTFNVIAGVDTEVGIINL